MLLISYDLHRPTQNYKDLIAAIKTYDCLHVLESTWLVQTSQTSAQVSQNLRSHIDSNDRLLVIKVHPQTADGWLTKASWTWISGRVV